MNRVDVIALGGSAGSIEALRSILPALPADSPLSFVVVIHQHRSGRARLAEVVRGLTVLPVAPIEDRTPVLRGKVFVAPADYHVYIERDESFSLSIEPPVAFSRPNIDVFFESAAYVYGGRLVGVLLSGANTDGARGLSIIAACGGAAICQDPYTASEPTMPAAGRAAVPNARIASPVEIGSALAALGGRRS